MNRKPPVSPVLEDPTPSRATSDSLNRPEFSLPAKTKSMRRTFYVYALPAVLLVLAGVGFAGYRIKTSMTTANKVPQSSASASAPAQHTAASQQYLTIKEWGVKLPLSVSIKDAYYVPSDQNRAPDGTPGLIWVGLKSLDATGCDLSNVNTPGTQINAIGSMFRVSPSDRDNVTGELFINEYPGATIGNYYYVFKDLTKFRRCAPAVTLQSIGSAFTIAIKGTISTVSYAGWREYCSTAGGLCLKYPYTWQVDDQSANGGTTVIANASKSVAVIYNPTPQIGGACQGSCYFTQDSLSPVATANSLGLEVLTGVWENTAYAEIQPYLVLVSSSTLSQYHLVQGQKINVGFFAPVVISPVKSSSIETLTVDSTPAKNFSSYSDARAWLQQPDVLTAKNILASAFVK